MKKLVLILVALVGIGCAKSSNLEATVTGRDGKDGRDGVSCTVVSSEGGAVISCGDGTSVTVRDGQNGTNGTNGQDGQNGTSCSTQEAYDDGYLISCGDGSEVEIHNGRDGQNGQNGQNGSNGSNGKDGHDGSNGANVDEYSSDSCVKIGNTDKYTKSEGNKRSIYKNSNCSSSSKEHEVSEDDAYWVSGNSVCSLKNGSLRVITFN
jgi:hypothetical protein